MASYPLSLTVAEPVSVPFPNLTKVGGLLSAFFRSLGFRKGSDVSKGRDNGKGHGTSVRKRRYRRRGGLWMDTKGFSTERKKR